MSVITTLVVTPLIQALGAPPLDVSTLQTVIEGDLVSYLVFLIPITWVSAAIGEELIARGFLLDRFMRLYRPRVAVVAQATIFALAHISRTDGRGQHLRAGVGLRRGLSSVGSQPLAAHRRPRDHRYGWVSR